MAALVLAAPSMAFAGGEPLRVLPNDNRHAAGTLADNTLTLNLRAGGARGVRRETPGPRCVSRRSASDGDALRCRRRSFASATAPPSRPRSATNSRRPLPFTVSVPAPARVVRPVDVPPGERAGPLHVGRRRNVSLLGDVHRLPLAFRGPSDTQLSGAFVVDPRGPDRSGPHLRDHRWTSLTRDQLKTIARADDPGVAFERSTRSSRFSSMACRGRPPSG